MERSTETSVIFAIDRVQLSSIQRASIVEAKVTELFKLLWEPLLRYLIGIVGNHAEAEELAQEAFLALYNALRRGDAIRNCRAWVFRVAHNLAINSQEKRSHTEQVHPVVWERIPAKSIDPSENAEERILVKERQSKVEAVLVFLSQQERRCLALRAEGLRFREIAEVLGLSTSTVETFIERGIRKIMKKLYD